MFEKYKDLHKQRADFFPYSVFRPEVLTVLRKHAADVLGPIKDQPALLSVCLSNEPINVEEPSEYSTLCRSTVRRQRTTAFFFARSMSAYFHALPNCDGQYPSTQG